MPGILKKVELKEKNKKNEFSKIMKFNFLNAFEYLLKKTETAQKNKNQ